MISRRGFLAAAGAGLAGIVVPACSSGRGSNTTRRPGDSRANILVVLADDMRADFLPGMRLLNQRLQTSARVFDTTRCNVGLCEPFRVGLLRGQMVKHHHVAGNADPTLNGFDHDNTIGRWLHEAGYRTGLIGKYLNGTLSLMPKPTGWDAWLQVLGDSDPASYSLHGYGINDGTTVTRPQQPQIDFLRDATLEFVRGSEPWFCLMTPTVPHYPFDPLPDDAHDWSSTDWPIVFEDDVSDKPSWIRALPPITNAQQAQFEEQARKQLRQLDGLDQAIDVILRALSPATLAQTVIVFASDNGLNYGEHHNHFGGSSKNDLYETSLRVPLAVMGPGFRPGHSTAPVSAEIDVAATIVRVAGASPGLPGDGVDLRQVQDDPARFDSRVLLHYRHGGGSLNPNPNSGDAVTTSTRKLIRWQGVDDPDRFEMYDLDRDPNELRNVAYDPSRIDDRRSLDMRIDEMAPV